MVLKEGYACSCRYNLTSSTPLAQLWFQSLCIVWNEEPTSASYLMDVVLSCAFFRPDITAMAYDNLAQLLQVSDPDSLHKLMLTSHRQHLMSLWL